MAKLSIKNINIESKEIEIPGFEDTLTIYPINGFGLVQLNDFVDKINKKNEERSLLEAQLKKLKTEDAGLDDIEEIGKINDKMNELENTIFEIQKAMAIFSLKYGAKADDATIDAFIENDFEATLEMTTKIVEYATEYATDRAKKLEFAKKKLKK